MSQRYLGGIITANPTAPTTASASGVWTLEQQFQNLSALTPATIQRSVRLRGSASAYLTRTLSVNSTSQTKMTWSGWVKRGTLGAALRNCVFYVGNSAATSTIIFAEFYNDTFRVLINGGATVLLQTTQVFRDPSAWYHIVFAYDSTQGTSSDRMKLYINGVQVTAFSSAAYPALNATINNVATTIQQFANVGSVVYDGYLAEQYFIDGQGLPASSFGAFDSSGVWQPLSYSGTYGANGFYLTFADNSAATATTLGKDYSGNGNNFTPNSISVTAGVTYDSMLDSPTNSVSASNYCVLNPLDWQTASFPITNGNLTWTSTTTAIGSSRGTTGMTTGKWYWEVLATSVGSGSCGVGIAKDNSANFGSGQALYTSNTGNKYIDGTTTAYGATWATNNVIGVAYDADAGQITFYKDNTSQGAITLSGYAGVNVCPVVSDASSLAFTLNANFGQRPFAYTPPTGFLALNTQNLPAVTINNGAQYMAATLYTGNNATNVINNGANNPVSTTFQPDMVWIKSRSAVGQNTVQDVIRGVNKYVITNSTGAEGTDGSVTSFNSNGFSLTTDAGVSYNANGTTYVGWQWKAGGTAVSNTSGSITSSVSANTTAGFSVVTYTGTGALATVGHGLGVAPSMVMIKSRSQVANWTVYHSSVGNTGALFLNLTNATDTGSAYWNNTSPTSSVFTINLGSASNTSGQTYVAYCFAAVAGYSAFGSYTGNGSADGPFIYCGFRPRYVMIKETGASGNWNILDTSRSTYNAADKVLLANTSGAEIVTAGGAEPIDILSNGFKLRYGGSGDTNTSGGTYIYACFAENPFNVSRAR
jgi:hypothetical protein